MARKRGKGALRVERRQQAEEPTTTTSSPSPIPTTTDSSSTNSPSISPSPGPPVLTTLAPYLVVVWVALIIATCCCALGIYQSRLRSRRRREQLLARISELRERIARLEQEERERNGKQGKDLVRIGPEQIAGLFRPVKWGDLDKTSLKMGWTLKGNEVVRVGTGQDEEEVTAAPSLAGSPAARASPSLRHRTTAYADDNSNNNRIDSFESGDSLPAMSGPLAPLPSPAAGPAAASTPLLLPDSVAGLSDLPPSSSSSSSNNVKDILLSGDGLGSPLLVPAESTLRRLTRTGTGTGTGTASSNSMSNKKPITSSSSSPFLQPQPILASSLRPSQMFAFAGSGSPKLEWTVEPTPTINPVHKPDDGSPYWTAPSNSKDDMELPALPDSALPLPEASMMETVSRTTTPISPDRKKNTSNSVGPAATTTTTTAPNTTPRFLTFSPRALFAIPSPRFPSSSPAQAIGPITTTTPIPIPIPSLHSPSPTTTKSPAAFSTLTKASYTDHTCLICLERELSKSSEVLRFPGCGHGQWCFGCGVDWIGACCNAGLRPAERGEEGGGDEMTEGGGEGGEGNTTAEQQGTGAQESRQTTLADVRKKIVCPLCRAEFTVPFKVHVPVSSAGALEARE